MNQTPQPAGPARERTALSVPLIAQAALDLIDEQGLEALSIRKLGAALGVEAMSIYHHIPSKAALLDAVAELLLSLAPAPTAPPENWRTWLRQLGHGYYGLARRHPRAFPLLAQRRFNSPAAFAWFETALAVLHRAGLSPTDRARVFRALGAVVNGAGMAFVATVEPEAGRHLLNAFPLAERFPEVAAVAPYLREAEHDELFDFALEAMLDGVAPVFARAASSAGS